MGRVHQTSCLQYHHYRIHSQIGAGEGTAGYCSQAYRSFYENAVAERGSKTTKAVVEERHLETKLVREDE